MTSHNSTQLNIWDELTSSQEDSPANPIATQVCDLAKQTTDTSGLKCSESYERFNPPTWSVKMFRALSRGTMGWFSRRCKLTWKMKGTKYKRTYFQLAVSTLPTDVTGFGLLPTVMSQTRERTEEECRTRQEKYGGERRALYLDHLATMKMLPTPTVKNVTGGARQVNARGKRENKGGTEYGAQLHDLAKSKMLPTPNAYDWNTSRKPDTYEAYKRKKAEEGVNVQMPLKQMATNQMLPTPAARDVKGANSIEHLTKDTGHVNHLDQLPNRVKYLTGSTSQLSPLFVEEMMGFPAYWTALPFLDGDEKASKPTETPSSPK